MYFPNVTRLAISAIATTLFTSTASAAFSPGNAVDVTYFFPDTATTFAHGSVVGPTDSLSNFAQFLNITFTDTAITMTATRNAQVNNVSFDGIRFIDLNSMLSFSEYKLDIAATTFAGLDASRVSHAADTIYVNFANLPGLASQKVVLSASPVPELPTGALMLSGVAFMLALLRKSSALRHSEA